jgi:hypothetical protein
MGKKYSMQGTNENEYKNLVGKSQDQTSWWT